MIFSGIQPTGIITLGNYLGAINNFTRLNDEENKLFCIVDLHALTSKVPSKELKNNSKLLLALFIALDLHKKGHIFLQSHVHEHAELAWILQCKTGLGDLERMTQFKDKSQSQERPNCGLLTYPVLMAADILLYDTTSVPVGEDQKQHLELTRNIAQKFNAQYDKEIFTLPEPKISEIGAKIYSLTEPTKKMSKSDENPKSYISIMDDENIIRKKIKSATTDSIGEINVDKINQPGIYNLLQIYASIKKITLEETYNYFKGQNYGFLKEEVANVVIDEIIPLQSKIKLILNDKELMNSVLLEGKDFASSKARKKMSIINKEIGLYNI